MIHLRPDPNGYDDRHWLALRGSGEGADGQTVKVNLGESVVVGRSRFCDWSLKRVPSYLTLEGAAKAERRASIGWRATSRRHCRVTYVAPDMVEVENLSPNGTFVDGHRVDRVVLTDCRKAPHVVRLGAHGVTVEIAPGALPI